MGILLVLISMAIPWLASAEPPGLLPVPVPADNPQTPEKIAVGNHWASSRADRAPFSGPLRRSIMGPVGPARPGEDIP